MNTEAVSGYPTYRASAIFEKLTNLFPSIPVGILVMSDVVHDLGLC